MIRSESYDAVVVGASFAGLAAAGELVGAGRILLVDREPVGAGETSACGAPLAVLERLDAGDALEQVHPRVVIHVAGRRVVFDAVHPYATFDYRALCDILAGRLDGVDIAVATFTGLDPDGALVLGTRRVHAPVVIDASGWRRVVARAAGAPPADRLHFSTGLEVRADRGGCLLEFWVRPATRPDGVYWAFPAGDHVRAGSAVYQGKASGLKEDLARFADVDPTTALPARAVHGGAFPSRLAEPVTGRIFLVGDAAGQCLPLTGEGIRPALVFGQAAGQQARAVLRGEKTLDQALAGYRTTVDRSRTAYRALERAQAWTLRLPPSVLARAIQASGWAPLSGRLQAVYWATADPDTLDPGPPTHPATALPTGQCASGPAANRRAQDPGHARCTPGCGCHEALTTSAHGRGKGPSGCRQRRAPAD